MTNDRIAMKSGPELSDVPRDQLEACAKEYMSLVEDIERTADSGLDQDLKLRVIDQLLRDFRA